MSGALVLGAVGATSAGAAKVTDPCQLLTEQQITKVLKQQSGPADPGAPNEILTQCYWRAAATGDKPEASVGTVIAVPPLAKPTFLSNSQSPNAQKVKGIKKASYDTDLRTLSALRGDTMISVQLLYFTPEDVTGPPEKAVIKLAKLALKKYES